MSKRLAAVSYLVVVLLACCAPATTAPTATGGSRDSARIEHAEFAFDYPADWANRAERYPDYIPHYPQFDTDEPAQVSKAPAIFWVGTRALPGGSTIETLFRGIYADMEAKGLLVKVIAEEKTTVDGHPALSIIYEQFWGEPLVRQRDLWVEKDGRVYVLSCRSRPSAFDEAIVQCDAIVETFELR
ncbi:MAG: PsbP-related protein [Anaerolineae bacterium]